jgi:hypothetical protein
MPQAGSARRHYRAGLRAISKLPLFRNGFLGKRV